VVRQATANGPTPYRRRRPERTLLYRTAQAHFATWLALARDGQDDADAVPGYIEREFRRCLQCGILAHGFARARCGQCGHDFLIAFFCTPRVLPPGRKGRGVCPSCAAKQIPWRDNTRRMVETAAHLAEHVISRLPVRQWVLSVPKRLRYFLHRDPDLQGAALRMFLGAVEQCLRAHSAGAGPAARLGAVAFILRFGSALNPYLHFHCVVLDGVFESTPTGGVVFHAATGLDAQAIAAVQATVRRRLLCSFARRGLLAGDDARDMAQWGHGGGFSAGLERLLRYDRRKSPFGTTEGSPLSGLRPSAVGDGTVTATGCRAPDL
jgi:ribosomal protein S27AE